MARVTYGLVGGALIALLLGIFVLDNTNTMLFVSIGLSIACIAMVIFGAARRARETPDAIVAPDPDFATIRSDSDDAKDSTAVLSAFEDADEEWDDEDEDEEVVDEEDEEDEEEVDEEEEEDDDFYEDDDDSDDEDDDTEVVALPTRSSKKKPTSSRPAAKTAARKSPSKAKPAAKKAAAKSKPAAAPAAKKATAKKTAKAKPAASGGKVVVVPGRDRFHKASCRFVTGKDDAESITLAAAKRGGYEPCSVCKP